MVPLVVVPSDVDAALAVAVAVASSVELAETEETTANGLAEADVVETTDIEEEVKEDEAIAGV